MVKVLVSCRDPSSILPSCQNIFFSFLIEDMLQDVRTPLRAKMAWRKSKCVQENLNIHAIIQGWVDGILEKQQASFNPRPLRKRLRRGRNVKKYHGKVNPELKIATDSLVFVVFRWTLFDSSNFHTYFLTGQSAFWWYLGDCKNPSRDWIIPHMGKMWWII